MLGFSSPFGNYRVNSQKGNLLFYPYEANYECSRLNGKSHHNSHNLNHTPMKATAITITNHTLKRHADTALTTLSAINKPPTMKLARFFLVAPRVNRTTERAKKGIAIMLNVFMLTSSYCDSPSPLIRRPMYLAYNSSSSFRRRDTIRNMFCCSSSLGNWL